jgi:uncharacterized membrane protein YcaP (DUF421 family)
MFFDSWTGLGRVLVVGTLAYFALVLTLRVSGKRTLSKLNAFDLSSRLRSARRSRPCSSARTWRLRKGCSPLALLVLLQFALAWLSVRSPRVQELLKSEPTLLLYEGRFLDGAMRQERITREEVLAALRGSGVSEPEQAAAVVLESAGSRAARLAHGLRTLPPEPMSTPIIGQPLRSLSRITERDVPGSVRLSRIRRPPSRPCSLRA